MTKQDVKEKDVIPENQDDYNVDDPPYMEDEQGNPISNLPDEGAVSSMVTTISGREVDMMNIPGKAKLDLVESGDLLPSQALSLPANMPGQKLKFIREAKQKVLDKALAKRKSKTSKASKLEEGSTEGAAVQFGVGDIVEYQGELVEILEVREEEKKYVFLKPGTDKNIKVNYTSVKAPDEE